jgi:hypothetical protein
VVVDAAKCMGGGGCEHRRRWEMGVSSKVRRVGLGITESSRQSLPLE